MEPGPPPTSQPSTPSAAAIPAQTAPQQPSQQNPEDNGTFVIRKDVDEVLLHATVIDDRER
ncbi:MAG: VWA domain-containing protein, partial [Candidatus Sulfotelmatobacter sp.]